ncbi:hypothetical protein SCWH03_11810 [Streptomyces pacificus]|uniref:Uncharacterized protein n=1 Tax=Streptomyces pacificus TaxID=2705029 RepID=A0A6A0ATM5_9ACTN|nr:hypothetical protein SCWH03_11810 [Streptomyces pacificus]
MPCGLDGAEGAGACPPPRDGRDRPGSSREPEAGSRAGGAGGAAFVYAMSTGPPRPPSGTCRGSRCGRAPYQTEDRP